MKKSIQQNKVLLWILSMLKSTAKKKLDWNERIIDRLNFCLDVCGLVYESTSIKRLIARCIGGIIIKTQYLTGFFCSFRGNESVRLICTTHQIIQLETC